MEIIEKKLEELKPYENNPRKNDEAVEYVANSIKEFGFKVPIIIDKNGVIIAGHTRYKASKQLNLDKVPCIIVDDLTEEQIKAFRLADNKVSEIAEWDFDLLDKELNSILDINMEDFGFEENFKDIFETEAEKHGKLIDRFVVPPVTIFDTRQGYWNERKKMWREKIADNAEARKNAIVQTAQERPYFEGDFNSVSLLDPVLSEIIVKWFMPKIENGINCFDVFAGDTVFGFVSSYLKKNFTGIELRKEQADFNNKRVENFNLSAKYICDDGQNVLKHIKENTQDLLFSCPPYFDLEVYSNLENDASNQKNYEEFYKIINTAFINAVKCLKNDRFAVIVAGDIRDKKTGRYYDFLTDIKNTFKNNGMVLYNEMILINSYGTAGIRANKQMQNRKVVKVHQNILVFYKGDTNNIKENFGEVEIGNLEEFYEGKNE